MGMSTRGILGGLALALIGMPMLVGIDLASGPDMMAVSRHSRDGQRRRRAKGPQAKPRKRSNRLHVSKRTRRKHRRAA